MTDAAQVRETATARETDGSTTRLRVGVIGAGIGGLTVAIALHQKGFNVSVYEKAPQLGEIGAGINLTGTSTAILNDLGLLAELERLGVATRGIEFRFWQDGRTIAANSSLFSEAAETTSYSMHRADLHRTLVDALPAGVIHLDANCVAVDEKSDHVLVRFEDGTERQFDVLIGADGLHSTVRDTIHEPIPATYSGTNAIRSLAPMNRLPESMRGPQPIRSWVGNNRFVFTYPVRGGELLNVLTAFPHEGRVGESWVQPTPEDCARTLADEFRGWDPILHQVFEASNISGQWGIYDRTPLPYWSTDRVTLLGDAAHAVVPLFGQGANQAIEDAASLAEFLAGVERGDGDLSHALGEYEKVRLVRTTQAYEVSRANAAIFHCPKVQFDDVRQVAQNTLDKMATSRFTIQRRGSAEPVSAQS